MGCIKLDILERAPSKRSSQIRMDFLNDWDPIIKKHVSTYRLRFQNTGFLEV